MLSRVFTEKLIISRASSLSLQSRRTGIIRTLASKNDAPPPSFRPTRRTPKAIQKILAPKAKTISKKAKAPVHLSSDKSLGADATAAIEYLSKYGEKAPDHESTLRIADFMTAQDGSTEDLVGRRRALMEVESPEEAKDFDKNLMELIQQESDKTWENISWVDDGKKKVKRENEKKSGLEDGIDRMQKVYGPWSETIVRVDRVQKTQRGGTMVRYRALVIGGNLNGCAGFGVAKANAPNEAAAAAARVAKRNIFFIDRYNGSGLTSDLAGRHNSCRVALRSVNPNRGLNGHPLIREILKYFGITDCSAKSHGNRNVHNVVRATFKAIMTHESLEDVALKRGKRLMNLERAKRLKI
jgi:small subunit ribosomal protein S5